MVRNERKTAYNHITGVLSDICAQNVLVTWHTALFVAIVLMGRVELSSNCVVVLASASLSLRRASSEAVTMSSE